MLLDIKESLASGEWLMSGAMGSGDKGEEEKTQGTLEKKEEEEFRANKQEAGLRCCKNKEKWGLD